VHPWPPAPISLRFDGPAVHARPTSARRRSAPGPVLRTRLLSSVASPDMHTHTANGMHRQLHGATTLAAAVGLPQASVRRPLPGPVDSAVPLPEPPGHAASHACAVPGLCAAPYRGPPHHGRSSWNLRAVSHLHPCHGRVPRRCTLHPNCAPSRHMCRRGGQRTCFSAAPSHRIQPPRLRLFSTCAQCTASANGLRSTSASRRAATKISPHVIDYTPDCPSSIQPYARKYPSM
jgi:hypothetical protein